MTKREILILGFASVVLAAVLFAGGRLRTATGQGMVSESGNTILVVGQEDNARFPLFLVDAREQTLMVYKYDINGNALELSAARSYQWDKKLESYGTIRGPRPDEVRKVVTKR